MLKLPFISFLSGVFELFPEAPSEDAWNKVKERLQEEFVKVTRREVSTDGVSPIGVIPMNYIGPDRKFPYNSTATSPPSATIKVC